MRAYAEDAWPAPSGPSRDDGSKPSTRPRPLCATFLGGFSRQTSALTTIHQLFDIVVMVTIFMSDDFRMLR